MWLVKATLPFSELPPLEEDIAEHKGISVNLFFV
jgi:hypothetical protein